MFSQSIQETPLLTNFHPSILKAFNGSSNLKEHTIAFRAHISLFGTLNSLMYRAFSITQRGSAREWYRCLKPLLINFLPIACERIRALLPHQCALKAIYDHATRVKTKERYASLPLHWSICRRDLWGPKSPPLISDSDFHDGPKTHPLLLVVGGKIARNYI